MMPLRLPNRRRPVPKSALTTQADARPAKTSEDQWMNAELCWCAKMAQSAQAIAMDAGRSPFAELNA
jgi:hypothetical protein